MHAPGRGKGAQGRGSIIFDHEGAPCTDGRYYRHCRGRWRGVLSKGFGPDGKRKRYKVSGLTKQDVIEALRKKSEEINAGLSTRLSRVPLNFGGGPSSHQAAFCSLSSHAALTFSAKQLLSAARSFGRCRWPLTRRNW